MIEFSYGKADDDGVAPIRVDSGEYTGSVFRYSKVRLVENDDLTIEYETDLELMIRNGKECSSVTEFAITRFHKHVSRAILMTILEDGIGNNKG